MWDNILFMFTIMLALSLDDYGAGGVVFTLGITNRYLADIHNELKG